MKIIPVYKYKKRAKSRNQAREWRSIEEAMGKVDIHNMVAGQIIPDSSAYTFAKDEAQLGEFSKIAGVCEYIGREGIEFYPQELLIFKYDGIGPRPGIVFLRNIQVSKSKYQIPSQRVLLEKVFLYPLVKGRSIQSFRYSEDELIVPFPYDEESPNKPLYKEELEAKSPLLLDYYEKYKEIIKSQTTYSDKIRGPDRGEYYGLARTGPYSFKDTYVAFRDNTKWQATVVKSRVMPWGEAKRAVFQNHAVSICERKDGSGYITEDEAHYICAILNSKIVERYIYATSDSRSFRIRPPVLLPKYDKDKELHRRLSELSQIASKDFNKLDHIRDQIDEIYLAICSRG